MSERSEISKNTNFVKRMIERFFVSMQSSNSFNSNDFTLSPDDNFNILRPRSIILEEESIGLIIFLHFKILLIS